MHAFGLQFIYCFGHSLCNTQVTLLKGEGIIPQSEKWEIGETIPYLTGFDDYVCQTRALRKWFSALR